MTDQAILNLDPTTTDAIKDTSLYWRITPLGEQVLEPVNGQAFDRLGARATLEETFRDHFSEEDKLYIVAGSDSGHLIEHIRRTSTPKGSRFLFVDTPAVHAALKDKGVFEKLPMHIRCATADNWKDEADDFHLKDYLYIDGVEVVFSLAARSSDSQDYVQLAWGIRETMAATRWEALAGLGSESFILRQIENAADNFLSATAWRGALKGHTGILLAGGPSLDSALDWVKQHREKLVVLAVSRISKRLLDVGIEPDFVVSVDPQDESYEISRDMLRFSKAVTFINQYHVPPRLLGQWPHRSFYLGSVLPWQSKLNPAEPLTGAGPTVTNTTLDFACALGLSQIVLAGVDLCFTPEGHTHALGSFERKVGPRFALTQLEVETNDGQYANTTSDYAAAIKVIEFQAQRLNSEGIEIINPSPSAARIPGVKHVAFETLNLCTPPMSGPLQIGENEDTIINRLRHARAVAREMQQKLEEIKSLNKELQHARKIVEKIFDKDGVIHNRNLRKRLDKLEISIKSDFPDISRLIQQCSTHAFLRVMKSTQNVDDLDAKEIQTALATYYDTYIQGADRLRQMIGRGLDRARWRVREYEGTTALPELAERWLVDQEAGRFMFWLNSHKNSASGYDEETNKALARLQTAWEEDLSMAGGRHLERLKPLADLTAAHARIEQLFAQHNASGIRKVIAGLHEAPDALAAAPYLELAEGLAADLDQRSDEALGHYDAVLQSDQRQLWSTALLRIAGWALRNGHTDHARQALECLESLSPRYRPQYADVLAATGDLQGAIDVYERHLDEHPDDAYGMARLTRLLINAGAREAAELMLEHIESRPGAGELVAPLRQLLNKK